MTLASKLDVKNKEKNLGYYAYAAIQKHFQKILKWETEVKKDKDPEALHQMRVGMRRLRTAVTRFQPAVNLPKIINDKNISKIARRLGNLRDLDVLKETLTNLEQQILPKKERQSLQAAFNALEKQRKNALLEVRATLKDELYKSIKQNLEDWLERPDYQPLASLSMQEVLPDLLLPEVSSFLLHPGWLVGIEVEHAGIIVLQEEWKAEKIEQEFATENARVLHSLRKQAKRLRYQMELFSQLYGEAYTTYVAEVKKIQEILGAIQDSTVLTEWLVDVFKCKLETEFPTLATLLAQNRYQMWKQWQPLQKRYLQAKTRKELHLAVLNPLQN